MKWNVVLLCGLTALVSPTLHAEKIRVGVGHQSMCSDTYNAGIIVKELNLLEKHLPKTGKYKDATFELDWKDYTSGPPITNMMLANKLDFGVMGDYPLIVNGAKFQETASLRSLYVAGTGYNLHGSGNAIVVPIDSDIQTLEDLKGKDISTPVGSAAWGMTLKALQDKGISSNAIDLKNQTPPVGAANIAKKRVSAHADFCPWSEIMEFRGTGRKIYDGSETGVPYLHGVVVRKEYAERYPEVVVAFLKAVIEAGQWVEADPVRAAESLEKWTGIEKEVQYLYFSKGGHLTLDPTIKPAWVDALKLGHSVLSKERQIPPLDFDQWITDKYVRQAYKELGLDYEKAVAQIYDPRKENRSLPQAEVWHAKNGIQAYSNIAEALTAIAEYEATGQKVNATYVYDHNSGLKLFGHVAYYVQDGQGNFATFMRKPDAEAYATQVKGKVLSLEEVIASIPVETAEASFPTGGQLAIR